MEEKLRRLMKHEGINSTRLAEILGIQASGISHIMSGRNKPSFDFLLKLLQRFPQISPDWLLLDKGPMYRDEIKGKSGGPASGASTVSGGGAVVVGQAGGGGQAAWQAGQAGDGMQAVGLGAVAVGQAGHAGYIRQSGQTTSGYAGQGQGQAAQVGETRSSRVADMASMGGGVGNGGAGGDRQHGVGGDTWNTAGAIAGSGRSGMGAGVGNGGAGAGLFGPDDNDIIPSRPAHEMQLDISTPSARAAHEMQSASERFAADRRFEGMHTDRTASPHADLSGNGNVAGNDPQYNTMSPYGGSPVRSAAVERIVVFYRDKTFSEYRPGVNP